MDKKNAMEDLQFIKKIIEDSKKTVLDNGIQYIVWGILIVIGLFTTNILTIMNVKIRFYWVWMIIILLGWIYSYFSIYKRNKSNYSSFAQRIINSSWLACGIGMTLLGFVGPAVNAYKGAFVSPILAVILGIAFFISTIIYEVKWMKLVPYGWWIGALYMFIFPGKFSFIIMGTLMIFFQIAPGIFLYRKFKKEAEVLS